MSDLLEAMATPHEVAKGLGVVAQETGMSNHEQIQAEIDVEWYEDNRTWK